MQKDAASPAGTVCSSSRPGFGAFNMGSDFPHFRSSDLCKNVYPHGKASTFRCCMPNVLFPPLLQVGGETNIIPLCETANTSPQKSKKVFAAANRAPQHRPVVFGAANTTGGNQCPLPGVNDHGIYDCAGSRQKVGYFRTAGAETLCTGPHPGC